jgi:antitoxin VapB
MGAQRSTKVFKSGNSKAVRLPADYPLELGQEVIVREEGGRYVIEPVRRKIDLSGIAGSMPWLKPLTPEERMLDERELDWDLSKIKRG